MDELTDTLEQVAASQSNMLWFNSTAVSLSGEPLPLPAHWLARAELAYDLVYGADPTPFVTQASQAGCASVADGLGMLVEQAADAFALWRGQRPQTQAVYDQLRSQLG